MCTPIVTNRSGSTSTGPLAEDPDLGQLTDRAADGRDAERGVCRDVVAVHDAASADLLEHLGRRRAEPATRHGDHR
jgi:hypothetical protein